MTMLVLTEDQQLLADSAREVVEGSIPVSRVRAQRDRGEVLDPTLWAELTELGWPAIPFSELHGGLDLGLAGLAVVAEALGRHAVPTPLASTAAATILDPAFGCAEGRVLAVAWREGPHHRDAGRVATRAHAGRLTGRKVAVADARSAEAFVVSAMDADGLGLWRVEAADATVMPRATADHHDHGDLVLDGTPGVRLTGDVGTLHRGLDAMRVILAAEALGLARGVTDLTVAYLCTREQFGVPIGSFQALQHRMVDAFVQVELAASAVMQAAREPSTRWAALAQSKSAEALLHVAKEAVQLHGGIGVTDECDVGFYLKRAMVLAREADGAVQRFARAA